MSRGRGFLFSITLTELLILLFFLLLLLAAHGIRHWTQRAEAAEARNEQYVELKSLLEEHPETDFVELIRETMRLREREASIAEAADKEPEELQRAADTLVKLKELEEEIARREQELALSQELDPEEFRELAHRAYEAHRLRELEAIEASVSELASMDPEQRQELLQAVDQLNELRAERSLLRGQVAHLRKQCGTDLPPCWVEDEETGKPDYIYDITIYDNHMVIEPDWSAEREAEVDKIPGARELAGEYWSLREFRTMATPVLQWAKAQDPECRHFVIIRDAALAKEPFLDQMVTVEEFFYKLLIRRQ